MGACGHQVLLLACRLMSDHAHGKALGKRLIPTTVLIVEDTPTTREWLHRVVSDAFPDVTIITATNLREARALVADGAFDLALVDLGLPDGSGHDLIPYIREKMGSAPYIVVATIFDDDSHLISALREGANGYLLKDESSETMIEHLKGITEDRAPMSSRSLDAVLGTFQKNSSGEVPLTDREQEVLRIIAKGYNVTEAAEMLGLTRNTVKSYVKTIYAKLDISSRAEATAEALKRQLIDL